MNPPVRLPRPEIGIPAAIFLVICLIELLVVLRLNEGRFVYTLDDPYIHLAVAENLARGHYGVNADEFSAPSSSIAWPFLLAPFARTAPGEFVPLVVNLIVSVLAIGLFARVVRLSLDPAGNLGVARVMPWLVLLLVVAGNLVGMAFTGMEHSLQLFLASAIVWGLGQEARSGTLRPWLPVALVAGPLVRFELLALSAPALVYLVARGHGRAAAITGALLAAFLGAFALYLSAMELGPVPSSVIAKSTPVATGGRLRSFAGNVSVGLGHRQGGMLALAGAALLFRAVGRGENRAFAAWGAAAVAIHFLGGRFDWYHRYENYIWVTVLLTLVHVERDRIVRLVEGTPRLVGLGALGVIALAASYPYVHGLYTLPVGSNNIFEQQYQMHRFVTEYWRAPVAVNDLGWVSFRNEEHVLDLWGLGSRPALEKRLAGEDWSWVAERASEKDAKLAMVYGRWFRDVPSTWIEVGTLSLGRKLVTVAQPRVTFFAFDEEAAARAESLVREFRTTLPAGVEFELAGGGR